MREEEIGEKKGKGREGRKRQLGIKLKETVLSGIFDVTMVTLMVLSAEALNSISLLLARAHTGP